MPTTVIARTPSVRSFDFRFVAFALCIWVLGLVGFAISSGGVLNEAAAVDVVASP